MTETVASRDIVIFCIGDEKFALTTDEVKSIEELQEIIPVPRAPEYIAGLINLRGAIIPVMDLRRRLGAPAAAAGRDTVILIVEHGDESVGLIVDRVEGVDQVSFAVTPVPAEAAGGPAGRFYRSVLETGGQKITIINKDNLLTLEERT
ncbi:MAG: chemotaxis protein CheW [Candidatus Edwardsbacteria bacterium]|jgi:purine-binding chemotaxis protein CheW|nr:chemotaxis protein CheW [Candidatus Edwardsbacteria bacterium]